VTRRSTLSGAVNCLPHAVQAAMHGREPTCLTMRTAHFIMRSNVRSPREAGQLHCAAMLEPDEGSSPLVTAETPALSKSDTHPRFPAQSTGVLLPALTGCVRAPWTPANGRVDRKAVASRRVFLATRLRLCSSRGQQKVDVCSQQRKKVQLPPISLFSQGPFPRRSVWSARENGLVLPASWFAYFSPHRLLC
jgi:hypothetical protein